VKIIFVAGSWGSGTTALAGALAKLGVSAFGPHFRTNDPRTPASFELIPFRNLILGFVDEATVSFKGDRSDELVAALRSFAEALERGDHGAWSADRPKRALLKMPLATICLPQITAVFETSIILVHRRFDEIEASRKRRNWPAYFGAAGARTIYSRAISDLAQLETSYLAISYLDLKRDTEGTLQNVMEFCGLQDLRVNLPDACAFVRNDEGKRTDGSP